MDQGSPLPTNTSFSLHAPGLQIALDSTSIGAGKTCARYYQYVIGSADEPGYATRLENVHFIFGIEYHAALELYDRKRAEGEESPDIAPQSYWDKRREDEALKDLPRKAA